MFYKNTYRLKQLEEIDFPALQELLWKVFQKKSSILSLKHKYDVSHLGLEYVSTIAYENEIPVAFYGAILQKFKKHNQKIIIAQACDSSTLKAHQGKGLHFELAKLSYEIMQKQGITCVYAFLNENSFYSTKKLDWHSHFNMLRFHIKVNTFPLAKVLNKLHINNLYFLFLNKNVSQEAITKLTSDHKDKFQQICTPNFFAYKNRYKNHYCIEVENCVFWVKIEAIMHVGLFFAPSGVALQKGIKKLRHKAFFFGISEILFQVGPKTNLAKQLKTIAVPKKSWHVGYLPFEKNIDLKDFKFNYSDLDTF
tara:strand:- start:23141 stop:24067 length:927 start_codon:yes stop_codon:yes gene_type:complete